MSNPLANAVIEARMYVLESVFYLNSRALDSLPRGLMLNVHTRKFTRKKLGNQDG